MHVQKFKTFKTFKAFKGPLRQEHERDAFELQKGAIMPSNKIEMSLKEGQLIAQKFLRATIGNHFATFVTVAGSIRRLRPIAHDIDLVFSPTAPPAEELRLRCEMLLSVQVVKWGPKLAAIIYEGIPIDLYFSTPETFQTLLLIRTGSKENNIRLCSIARTKGWKLHASGDGLFNEKGERIAGDSERSIYDALGVPYQEPWEREAR